MKLIGLISGGIDSPVAIHLMQGQGAEVIPLHFDLGRFAGEDTVEKVKAVSRKLGFKEMYIVPHGEALSIFSENADIRFTCVFCKRTMLRVAGRLAKKLGAEALVTGEALGQVASQTPENLRAENAVAEVPVLRPLIGMNKEEIVQIARKIGTFAPSTVKASCCSAVPSKPATKARKEQLEAEEAKFDLEDAIKHEVKSVKKIKL